VTKLPPDGERAIRRLDEIDEAEDFVTAAGREPYRSRLLALLSLDAREVAAFGKLRRRGLLDFFRPPKRKPGEHRCKPDPIDYAIDDYRRLKDLRPRRRLDDQVTRELIAAERCRRFVNRCCTIDKFGRSYEAELQDLVDKIRNRLRRGTTGGERHRRRKLRAK
jgi:hypothetical protein